MQKRRCGICLSVISFILILICSFVGSSNINLNAEASERLFGDLEVHFIDVGQGDCIFIKLPDGKNMIIDGGRPEYGDEVVSYLTEQEIDVIDYMIATHSDEDHIGGLIAVLDNFDVKTIVRPFDMCKTTTDSGFIDEFYLLFGQTLDTELIVVNNTYASFLEKAYGEVVGGSLAEIKVCSDKLSFISNLADYPYLINFYMPKALEEFSTERVDGGYTIKQVEDKNETSAIVGLFTKNQKYLFCGDATINAETELLSGLTADERAELSNISLLKVSHHGGKTGTSEEFLNIIKPKYSVIMVGKDNDYGHPTNEVLERLNNINSMVYRTDECGSIVVKEKGVDLEISVSKTNNNAWIFYGILIGAIVCVIIVCAFYPIIKKKRKYKKIKHIN